MAKYEKYPAPYADELRELGYEPIKTSPKASELLIQSFTSLDHPYKPYITWYINKYGNVSLLVRKSIAVYAHGLDNFNQYSKDYNALIYQCYIRITRDIMNKYTTFFQPITKAVRLRTKDVEHFDSIYLTYITKEAKDQIQRKNGEEVPYVGYKHKREKNKTGKNSTCMYRIERLADMYN